MNKLGSRVLSNAKVAAATAAAARLRRGTSARDEKLRQAEVIQPSRVRLLPAGKITASRKSAASFGNRGLVSRSPTTKAWKREAEAEDCNAGW